ncbi:MAG: ATP-binding protein [Phycisphaerae bacterium]
MTGPDSKPRPGESIRMHLLSTPWQLGVVRAAVEKICQQVGLDEKASGEVMLGVDEALTNVVRHAYEDAPDQPIDLEIALQSDQAQGQSLRIVIRDHGRQVPLEDIRSRDLADIRPGGLGVHIMQTCMDSVEFHPAEEGGTVLTMIKNIQTQQKESHQE